MRGTEHAHAEHLAAVCMPLLTGPVGILIGYLLGAVLRLVWVMCNFILTGAVGSLVPAEDPVRVFVARVGGGVGFFGVLLLVLVLHVTDNIRPDFGLSTAPEVPLPSDV